MVLTFIIFYFKKYRPTVDFNVAQMKSSKKYSIVIYFLNVAKVWNAK